MTIPSLNTLRGWDDVSEMIGYKRIRMHAMLNVAEELWETDKRGRVSYRGGPGTSPLHPPLPEIFKLSVVIKCFVTGIKQQYCPRLCQKQSERIYINSQFFWWGHAPRPMHADTYTFGNVYVCNEYMHASLYSVGFCKFSQNPDAFKDKKRQIQLQYIKPIIMLYCCVVYPIVAVEVTMTS